VKNFINKLLVNHSLIYKLFLYVSVIVLVVYLFPKGGQFKYEFQKGKPWQYENYYAPFNFAIKKSNEEVEIEKIQIQENSKQYFEYNEEVALSVKNEISDKINLLLDNSQLSENDKSNLTSKVNVIVASIYEFGYLEASNDLILNNKPITLRKGNKIQDIQPYKLYKSSQILTYIKSIIGVQPYTPEESNVLNIIHEELKPNVSFDESFTEKVIRKPKQDFIYKRLSFRKRKNYI